jgi:hypothetical protein
MRSLFATICCGAVALGQTAAAPRPAVPLEPTAAILDAFKTHAIVALGDGVNHGDEQSAAFRSTLYRDPRFVSTVNDIVVEFGSARYQSVADRFVNGEPVPEVELRKIWQETTQPTLLVDLASYQNVLRIVRELNASLPASRRLRVLLGDPPIEWESVHTHDEFQKWLAERDEYPAGLIQREVLAKHRRALVVYGQMHFQRAQLLSNYDMSSALAQTIVSLLERDGPTKVFTIWPTSEAEHLQADVSRWPVPSVALIRGTVLGAADFTEFYTAPVPRVRVKEGQPDFNAQVPREEWKSLRAEDQFDAVMYMGPKSSITYSKPAPSLCADPAQVRIRLARIGLAGLPPREAERIEQLCGVQK